MKSFISGVLLAAGESKRFADHPPKQLLELQGEPLIHLMARRALASGLSEVIVVLGHQAEVMRQLLSDLPILVVCNEDYASGQSSSVRAGLHAVHASASAALFLPVDQPFLSTEVLDQLIGAHEEGAARITLPGYRERRGSPVLFDRTLFPVLAAITGDEGGRQILEDHREEIRIVALDSEDPLLDIDTPEQYRRLLGKQ